MMLKNIYRFFYNINSKEEINDAMILTSMSEHEQAKKLNKELEDSQDNTENNQLFLKI